MSRYKRDHITQNELTTRNVYATAIGRSLVRGFLRTTTGPEQSRKFERTREHAKICDILQSPTHMAFSDSTSSLGLKLYPKGTWALYLWRSDGYHTAPFVLSGLRLNLSCGFGK